MFRIESLSRELMSELSHALVEIESTLRYEQWDTSHFESDYPLKWGLSLIAFDDHDKVVGYAIASRPDPFRAHLHRIVVAPACRDHALGAKLIAALRLLAGGMGLRRLSLKVANDNDGAIRFYRREGFGAEEQVGHYTWMSTALAESLAVACHQPNFLPWAGYFSKLVHCDCFVVLDDVQMPTGRSYVSRTRIADGDDARWLTVPVTRESTSKILDVKLAADSKWRNKHLGSVRQVLSKAPFRDDVLALMQVPYESGHETLAELNLDLLQRILAYLGIRRRVVRSSAFNVRSISDQRLLDLVLSVGGTQYLSGKGGQNYQEPKKFVDAGVTLDVREYRPIEYARGSDPFVAGLSIIDLIGWCGPKAVDYLRYDAGSDSADR